MTSVMSGGLRDQINDALVVAVRKLGVEVCTDICARLIEQGIPGIHFYCLNRVASVRDVITNLQLEKKSNVA